jgi:hypothetical protein
MKASVGACSWIVGAAVGLTALAAPVSPALGAGFSLHLSAPGTPVVGKPMILQATGTIPQDELEFPYWFSLDAIPVSVTTECPPDRFESAQLATSTGGAHVVNSQREVVDAAGSFTIPVGITPTAPGSVLLCGYTDDGMATTVAATAMILNIEAGSSSKGGSRPASIPVEALRGVRSCRALLSGSGARSCVRRAIRQANAGCRRLHSPRSRAKCLRAVRRVGRSH